MPRKTPITTIDVLGQVDTHPAQDVGEYFTSKNNERLFMRPPFFDISSERPDSFYIDSKIENNVGQEQLAILLKEKCAQRHIYANRIRLLEKSHFGLKSNFSVLNVFIRESEEKKKKAIREINEQIAIQKELRNMIDRKREAVKELRTFREELELTAQEYAPYETLLTNVVRKSQKYGSVVEMINHCDSIMKIQDEVESIDAKLSNEIEGMRKRILEIVAQAGLIVLGLKTSLADMHRAYKIAHSECLRWERILAGAKDLIIENNDKKSRTLDGISLLYRLLCMRRSITPKYVRGDVELELDFIRDEVELLQEVLREFDKQKKSSSKQVTEMALRC